MQLLKQMVPSAALAAAVAAVLLFVFAHWWKSASRCAGAIAIGAGYVAGHVLAAGWSPFPPRHATHWLFWFAIIGVIAAAADALVRPKGTVRFAAWVIICTIACRLILQPKIQLWLERCGRLALGVCHRNRYRGSDLLSRSRRAQTIWRDDAVFGNDSSLRGRWRRVDFLRQFVARTARRHSQCDGCDMLSSDYRGEDAFPSKRRCRSS